MKDKKFIVAYDGSSSSEKALQLATDLAKSLLADIVLVFVVDLSRIVVPGTRVDVLDRLEAGEKFGSALGVSVTSTLLEGYPPEEIIRYAQEQKADMIVVGTRGLGGFKRLLLGSTAQTLITYSDIPVLVAK